MADEAQPNTNPSIEDRISSLLNAPEEPQTAEHESSETESQQAESQETEQSAESESASDEPQAEAEEIEEIEIDDIGSLAEHLGVDPADLYNVTVPYTENGERKEFTLGEIKDQLPTFRETLSMREQAEATLQKYQEQQQVLEHEIRTHQEQMGAMMQSLEQAMLNDVQNVDWNKLERENPGEWARMREQYRLKHEMLQKAGQQANQYFQQRAQQLEQQHAQQSQMILQREQQALLRAIPEWRDSRAADTERTKLAQYLREIGYSSSDIEGLNDHRLVRDLRKAMLYDGLKDSGEVAKKKVVKLAKKIVKPGQRQTERESQHDRERSLVKFHRNNPKSIDAAAARIAARMK